MRSINKQTVKNNIVSLRRNNNLTQKQMSEKLSVSINTYKKWEAGKNLPGIPNMLCICDQFGLTMDQILGLEE